MEKENNQKLYGIFYEYFFHDQRKSGESRLCKTFQTLNGAKRCVENALFAHGVPVYVVIREYAQNPAIMGTCDNGTTALVMHNCTALKASYVANNAAYAEVTVKQALQDTGFAIAMLDEIDADRLCMDAYGNSLSEEAFDDISADSEDASLHDYRFTYAVIMGCADTFANRKKICEYLEEYGIQIEDE